MIKSIAHCVTPAGKSTWLHTCNENLVLGLIPEGADQKVEDALFSAFERAITLIGEIKGALKKNSFVGGLYLVGCDEMTKAIGTISGIGETSTGTSIFSGKGMPSAVNLAFFQRVLGDSNQKLQFLESYLQRYMFDIQSCAKDCRAAEIIGILAVVIGYESLTGTTGTTFTYVTATGKTKTEFEGINCLNGEIEEFSFQYEFCKYNYSPVS